MSFLAMFAIKNREIHSAQCVHLVRDGLKVHWVHASSIAAAMIYLKTLWDKAKEKLVGKAVRVHFLGMGRRIATVASSMSASDPGPATRLAVYKNLLSKTLRQSVKLNSQHTTLMIAQPGLSWGIFSAGKMS